MEIYLIRHTTPQIGKGICYGQTDIPLEDSFQDEAKRVLENLPDTFDMIYSSPLSRCCKLAQLFNSTQFKSTQSIVKDDRLLEMNFGDWEMNRWDEINPAGLHNWTQDFVNLTVPGGEGFIQLHHRVNHFMDEIVKQSFERVAIITHAGVIRSFLISVLGIPMENAFRISIDYGSVTKINMGSDNAYNNVAYLNKL